MITALDKKTALILIDLQNMIVNLPLAHPVKDILGNVNVLLKVFHRNDLPVVIVRVDSSGSAWTRTRRERVSPVRQLTDELLEITTDIKAGETDIRITKHTWNAFFETALHEKLKQNSVTGIVLAGISTSIGVEGTARTASELGYNISFAVDAMTDMHEEAHQRSIQYVFPRMGETGTTAEIIAMMK